MSFADFFKKDVISYPSGAHAAELEHKEPKYSAVLRSLGKVVAGVAVASSFTACGLSRAEIDALEAQIPDSTKTELIAKYDSTLLANIDSLHATGTDMTNAVERGVSLTWQQTRDTMPSMANWKGESYVLQDHAQKRTNESRNEHSKTRIVYTYVNKQMQPYYVRDTYYEYKPEFRDQLAKEVQKQKEAKTAKTAQMLKAVQNGGR